MSKHTEGRVYVDVGTGKIIDPKREYCEGQICRMRPTCINGQWEYDAVLIAEAFNVAHETGRTPRQLAEELERSKAREKHVRGYWEKAKKERAELLEALRSACEFIDSEVKKDFGTMPISEQMGYRAAIQKCERGK